MSDTRIFSLAVCAAVLGACGQASDNPAPEGPQAETQPMSNESETPETIEIMPGLTATVLERGNGAVAAAGQVAVVHYTGWLYDPSADGGRGAKFDSSVDRDEHFRFPLGGGRVIRGWDEGVAGMKVGERRELLIAPELGYGDRAIGRIPPGSTLLFEVELAGLE